jgi:hypothetical protein
VQNQKNTQTSKMLDDALNLYYLNGNGLKREVVMRDRDRGVAGILAKKREKLKGPPLESPRHHAGTFIPPHIPFR